jgi:hypothetical protein
MEVTCWNCKEVTNLDKAAVESALAKMDETKLDFHDVECPKCAKANRTKREAFEKALVVLSTPPLTAREATQQTKEENAKRRGDEGKPDRPHKGRK